MIITLSRTAIRLEIQGDNLCRTSIFVHPPHVAAVRERLAASSDPVPPGGGWSGRVFPSTSLLQAEGMTVLRNTAQVGTRFRRLRTRLTPRVLPPTVPTKGGQTASERSSRSRRTFLSPCGTFAGVAAKAGESQVRVPLSRGVFTASFRLAALARFPSLRLSSTPLSLP